MLNHAPVEKNTSFSNQACFSEQLITAKMKLKDNPNNLDPCKSVPKQVIKSWMRCICNHLDTASTPQQPKRPAPRNSHPSNPRELRQIEKALDESTKQLQAVPHCFLLMDANCRIISSRINTPEEPLLSLSQAQQLQEVTYGGFAHTVLLAEKDGETVTLCGQEHYLDTYGELISSAAFIKQRSQKQNKSTLVIELLIKGRSNPTAETKELAHAFVSNLAARIETKLFKDSLQRAVESSANLFSASISLVNGAILAIDDSCRILNANNEACAILKKDQGNIVGSNFLDFVQDEAFVRKLLGQRLSINNRPLAMRNSEEGATELLVSIRPVDNNTSENLSLVLLQRQRTEEVDIITSIDTAAMEAKGTFDMLVGSNAAFTRAKQQAMFFAPTFAPLVITGEVYTGKSLFAQAIHNEGRKRQPFLSIDCALITEEDGAKILFGYETSRGTAQGLLDKANGGTLVLEDIEKLPRCLQTPLAHASISRRYRRSNGTETVCSEFRIIATTSENLIQLANQNLFDKELCYRLITGEIRLPSLKDRKEDILLLARNESKRFREKHKLPYPLSLSNKVRNTFLTYDWPGNIVQLNSVIHRLCDLGKMGEIQIDDLPDYLLDFIASQNNQIKAPKTTSMKDLEREQIALTLESSNGNVSKAAKTLGISRTTLYAKMKSYEINVASSRES